MVNVCDNRDVSDIHILCCLLKTGAKLPLNIYINASMPLNNSIFDRIVFIAMISFTGD